MNRMRQFNHEAGLTEWPNSRKSLGNRPYFHGTEPKRALEMAEWIPLVDISEDDQEYQITAELPGVRKEDVRVTAHKGTLTIRGARRFEKQDKARKYHRVERVYGCFLRNFRIPYDACRAKLTAEFRNGVLTVHLVKTEGQALASWN